MSDKEWYEGLTAEELEGKHVHAVYDYGTVVDGELCRNGRVRLDHRDEDGAPVFVIDDGRVVSTFAHILSVSLVWDERDWEQIRTVDMSKADAIVVNGRLIRVNGLSAHHQFRPVVGFSVSFEHVSCALRCRHRLPTEPGAYRGADGTLLMLTDISLPDKWMYVSEDFKECGVFLGDEQAEEHLPLTPVHFVDGRAE